MSILKRYFIFALGILGQSLGIALVVKSCLGTSPISSIPYVLSQILPYTLGETTFAINMIFLLAQRLLLGKHFPWMQWMQAPVTLLFAVFIDGSMQFLAFLHPENYIFELFLLFIGAVWIAFGVALQVTVHVLMLPGEGIVQAIALHWKLDFGKVKTCFDTTLVLLAAILSLIGLSYLIGIREGTLLSALVTGNIARFFIRHFSKVASDGSLYFCPHWKN